jgi:hypothetical protein
MGNMHDGTAPLKMNLAKLHITAETLSKTISTEIVC